MKKIVCFRGRDTIDHTTDMSKSERRGWWDSMVRGSVASVTTLLAGLILLLLPATGARAASFTVTDLKDGVGANYFCTNPRYKDDFCTLRLAISASNANGQSNTISLPAGDYHLNSALPPITSAMMIKGEGADLVRIYGRKDFGNRFRVFEVVKGGTLELHNVTIREGHADGSSHLGQGGGLWNAGVLRVHRSIIEANNSNTQGGGIYNSGRLELYTTTVRNNNDNDNLNNQTRGGGLYNVRGDNRGSVWIEDSTISGNKAGFGAGIANYGEINIVNSTISGNETTGEQVDPLDPDWVNAGGILNFGVARLKSVTITGNLATGGRSCFGECLRLGHTWAGGVYNYDGDFYFANTIIAGNSVVDSGIVGEDCSGVLISQRGNLVGDPGFSTNDVSNGIHGKYPCIIMDWPSLPSSGAPRDQIGRKTTIGRILAGDIFVMDSMGFPKLQPNGGPTETHALCNTKYCIRAIDQAWTGGPFACEAHDQRGVMRVGRCDIGAYEAQ